MSVREQIEVTNRPVETERIRVKVQEESAEEAVSGRVRGEEAEIREEGRP